MEKRIENIFEDEFINKKVLIKLIIILIASLS